MSVMFCKCDGYALIPQSNAALIVMDGLPRGTALKVEVTQPRNGKFHRLAWAFFTYVAEALNDGPAGAHWSPDDVKDDLLVATGHCRTRKMSNAERRRNAIPHGVDATVSAPKSISFSSMDEAEFGKFMDAAFVYVRDELCTWISGSPHWADIQTILRQSYLLGSDEVKG